MFGNPYVSSEPNIANCGVQCQTGVASWMGSGGTECRLPRPQSGWHGWLRRNQALRQRPQSAAHSNNKYRGRGRSSALGTEKVLNVGLLGMRGWLPFTYLLTGCPVGDHRECLPSESGWHHSGGFKCNTLGAGFCNSGLRSQEDLKSYWLFQTWALEAMMHC